MNEKPKVKFASWPADLLIDYVRKIHHRGIRKEGPDLIALLDQVTSKWCTQYPELVQLTTLFTDSVNALDIRRAAHDLGVAEVNAVLIAPGEGVAHARTCPDVQPLGAAVWPQLHEVEANTELGIVEVHQVVAVGLDGHRSGV